MVRWSIGPLVGPHIILNVLFLAVCGQIHLEFGNKWVSEAMNEHSIESNGYWDCYGMGIELEKQDISDHSA